MSLLEVRRLCYAYRPERPVLQGLDFRVGPGLTAVLGPNGAGKSTLLRCLLGALEPSSGEVLLDGRELHRLPERERARLLAYVPQFPRAPASWTALEVVLLGRLARLGPLGLPGERDLEVARLALERTGTAKLAERPFGSLSGGEGQRVMLARALAQEPALLLLDEPASHLDVRHQLELHALLRELGREGVAVLLVSHELELAARYADRLLVLRKGRLVADGTVNEVLRSDVLEAVYGVQFEVSLAGPWAPRLRPLVPTGGVT